MSPRITKLRVVQKTDVLVFEKSEYFPGNVLGIPSGSRIYCGHCGCIVGETKHLLKFPFSYFQFFASLENKKCDPGTDGSFVCHVSKCNYFTPRTQLLFGFIQAVTPAGWTFVQAETFALAQKPHIDQLKTVMNISASVSDEDQTLDNEKTS